MDRFGPTAGERVLSLFFPGRCLLCGELTSGGDYLCRRCEAGLSWEPLLRRYREPELTVLCPFPYEGAYRDALHRFKFEGERGLAGPMAACMARCLAESGEALPEAVCWVSMTARKRRERGYNQSALLARAAGKRLGLPALPLLEKLRETPAQHDLSREQRMTNLLGAYLAGEEAAGKRLLLVDDIVTTGATLRECAGALLQAGAKSVLGLCAARAGEP